jgi:hypothetical protein
MTRILLALSVMLIAVSTAWSQPLPADARFAYSWREVGGTTAITGTRNVTEGSNFTLEVWLTQTAGATNVLATEGGLFGGGVRTTYNSTPNVIGVTTTANITANAAFNDTPTFSNSVVANANFAQFTAATTGVSGAPATNSAILIGTFTYTVSGTVGQNTNLVAGDIPPANFSELVTFNNVFILDAVTDPSSLFIVVNPVPEPVTILSISVASLMGLRMLRRKLSGHVAVAS